MCFGVNMKPAKRRATALIGKGNRSHLMVVYKITDKSKMAAFVC